MNHLTNKIKFKTLDQLFVIFNNFVLNDQELYVHFKKIIHYPDIYKYFKLPILHILFLVGF